jgi:hypothetical protein
MGRLDRIRTEEYLRARYKKRFEPPAGRQSKLLRFLNTSFGLFLLSTVFISSFSWSFNAWLTHQKEFAEIQKNRQKLKIEVMNRLQYIDDLKEPIPYNHYHTIQNVLDGFIPSANTRPSWIPYYGAVFPEYQARSFISLLWELESLSDKSQREKLRAARAPLEATRRYLQKLQYQVVNAPGRNPEGKLELLKLSSEDRDNFIREVSNPLEFLRDPKSLEAAGR